MYPNSGLPVGKQVFGIKHIVYANCLDTVSHSYSMVAVTLQKPSSLINRPSKARLAILTLFFTKRETIPFMNLWKRE